MQSLYNKTGQTLRHCVRPYHVESTSSRLITAVKQHRAMLVLGWVTAWEYMVLYTFWHQHGHNSAPGVDSMQSLYSETG